MNSSIRRVSGYWFGLVVAWFAVVLLAGCGEDSATSSQPSSKAEAPAKVAADDSSYPLTTCVVSDKPLTSMPNPVNYTHEGREVRFCCDLCIDMFKQDPAKYLAKLDVAMADEQAQ